MAAKKATKKATKKSSSSAASKTKPPTFGGTCTPEKACKYLAELNRFFYGTKGNPGFMDDYTKLRKAVCNVERQAFGMGGVPDLNLRFCKGGGTGNEPADPVKPPVWEEI
jgi:hypothetical protein